MDKNQDHSPSGEGEEEYSSARRNFLRAAVAMTGGVALTARAAEAPMLGMDHSMMGHTMGGGGYDTMMFMPSHKMAVPSPNRPARPRTMKSTTKYSILKSASCSTKFCPASRRTCSPSTARCQVLSFM